MGEKNNERREGEKEGQKGLELIWIRRDQRRDAAMMAARKK